MSETRAEKAVRENAVVSEVTSAVRKAALEKVGELVNATFEEYRTQRTAKTEKAYFAARDAMFAIREGRDPEVEKIANKAAADALAEKRAKDGDPAGALEAIWERPQRGGEAQARGDRGSR
jgi:hypothetical protein